MGYRPSRGRRLVIAFAFMVAVAIPVYFIANAYRGRENGPLIALTGLRETETPIPTPIPASILGLPATWTAVPTITARSTVTPTLTATPSPTPTLPYDFAEGFIDEVVHIYENGPRTMVKIVVPGVLAGEYEATVEIGATQWDYVCLILEESQDHLFCVGGRLPSRSLALIQVFQIVGDGEDSPLVFEETFSVPPFLLATATKTKRPASTSKPKNTPTLTNTPLPTDPPPPTATACPPQPTAPPWASPTPPGNPPC